jgi:sortase A
VTDAPRFGCPLRAAVRLGCQRGLEGFHRHGWALFAAVGLLALGYWSFVFIGSRLYQDREMLRFVTERQVYPQPVIAGVPSYPSTGSAVALLAIPRLGLSSVVVEGAEERELRLGPGHIPGTSLPGNGGNVAVAGHRDTFFRPLRLIRRDDTITVTTHDRDYQYKVVSMEIVRPDEVQVLRPVGHETLTLVTCYPFDFVGPAPKRFIVRADCAGCSR